MSKSKIFSGQPVFTQLLNIIPRAKFDSLVRKHKSNRYCKKFMAYDHLVTMLYSSFFQCTSLREVITGMQANSNRIKHLGLGCSPRKSTLAEANQRRSSELFADLYHQLYHFYFSLPDSRKKSNKDEQLFILDSTTISLFTSIMKGAGSYKSDGRKKGGVKAHMMINAEHDLPAFIDITEGRANDLTFLKKIYIPDNSTVVFDKAYIQYKQFLEWNERKVKWVTRQKSDASIRLIECKEVSNESKELGVLHDNIISMGRVSNQRITPVIEVRQVTFYDKENEKEFIFISNNHDCLPEQIADTYKKRWQIELLFKRIKQRYPLRYFLGDNPNAIKIQIWSALICDLLVKIVQKQVNKIKIRPWAYASLSAMIKHHLMTYLNLKEFLLYPEKALINYKPPEEQMSLF